jgi:ABC-type Fe3+/spermidine/putrescine transport system ATPase subunit
VLDARAVDGETVELAGGARLRAALHQPPIPGRALRLLVRPERVELGGTGPNTLSARVLGVMYLGDHSEVRLELAGGQRLLAAVGGGVSLSADDMITVRLAPDAFLDVT